MGHQHLGTLPRSNEWLEVIALIGGGADVSDVAASASNAAELQMFDASNDLALQHSFWLLTQIPQAARAEDFKSALRQLGLETSDQPSLIEIATEMMSCIDEEVACKRGRTDLGEMAQQCAVESLISVAGRQLADLFGPSAENTKAAIAGLATVQQFSVLARDFFSRLTRRQLAYYLSRELSNHVGVNSRFHTVREHRDFEEALDLHCRETSRIIKEFSGEWFSKRIHEGGVTKLHAGRFAHVAFGKIRDELRQRRGAHA